MYTNVISKYQFYVDSRFYVLWPTTALWIEILTSSTCFVFSFGTDSIVDGSSVVWNNDTISMFHNLMLSSGTRFLIQHLHDGAKQFGVVSDIPVIREVAILITYRTLLRIRWACGLDEHVCCYWYISDVHKLRPFLLYWNLFSWFCMKHDCLAVYWIHLTL